MGFEAPEPTPKGWLVLDPDSLEASLEIWQAADAMVIGIRFFRVILRLCVGSGKKRKES